MLAEIPCKRARLTVVYFYTISAGASGRSLKSASPLAQLQLMHLLDQRASRSTSSIIDLPNARIPIVGTSSRNAVDIGPSS